jgi:D-serine deaminase-like pyridoxal phosphate-dependent protein
MNAPSDEFAKVSDLDTPAQMPCLPIGTQVRILSNHACATAAQYDAYRVLDEANRIQTTWPRFSGW